MSASSCNGPGRALAAKLAPIKPWSNYSDSQENQKGADTPTTPSSQLEPGAAGSLGLFEFSD